MVLSNDPTDTCYVNFNEKTNNCYNCPGTVCLNDKLIAALQEKSIENLTYNQWVQTDRCSIEILIKPVLKFVDYFGELLTKLIPHSFIADKQTQFLKIIKENIKANEFVIICDFSKFIIQPNLVFVYNF